MITEKGQAFTNNNLWSLGQSLTFYFVIGTPLFPTPSSLSVSTPQLNKLLLVDSFPPAQMVYWILTVSDADGMTSFEADIKYTYQPLLMLEPLMTNFLNPHHFMSSAATTCFGSFHLLSSTESFQVDESESHTRHSHMPLYCTRSLWVFSKINLKVLWSQNLQPSPSADWRSDICSGAIAWLENQKSPGQAVLGLDWTAPVTVTLADSGNHKGLTCCGVMILTQTGNQWLPCVSHLLSQLQCPEAWCPHSGKCSEFIYFIYYTSLTDNTLSFTRYDTEIPFMFTCMLTALVALS